MSYLRLEKAVMTNLQESLRRELLRTNRSGAYSSSTLVDCNTRKYHGLLVVPVPELDDENHVLLSSLDCTVIQHGAEFNLGLHKYQGNNFSPNGHKYIREFDASLVPTTTYRVGGVILKKEVIFQHYEDRILIRYTLVEAHSATTLRFRPFLAFRSVRQFTHENMTASREYHEIDGGIKTVWNILRSRSVVMPLTRISTYQAISRCLSRRVRASSSLVLLLRSSLHH